MIKAVRMRPARPASRCTVFCEKIVHTASGDVRPGHATGFLYRGKDGLWLVTNWHVLTGRRPDDPGFLLRGYPQSPDRLLLSFASDDPRAFLIPQELRLYSEGKPVWMEYKREQGIDLAAIPINPLGPAAKIAVQDFARPDNEAFEPGLDVIVTGFPFAQSPDFIFPIWKRAMVATEPGYMTLGSPTVLLDMPGHPGMSGSPIYRSGTGFAVTRDQYDAFERAATTGEGAMDILDMLTPQQMSDATVVLSFVGVYAGATENADFLKLNLGRMFISSMVDALVEQGQPGHNPYPPTTSY